MICQHLLYAALLFRFLLQRLEMLQQQIAHGVCGLELERQYLCEAKMPNNKDAQQQLHTLLELLGA